MKETLKVIKVELVKLQYSEDAILDMLNLLRRAIEVAEKESPERFPNSYLNNLIQTKEKEVEELLEKDISEENIKRRFEIAKSHFLTDLDECL